ncbi:MAG TPA: hypothetical protein DCL08_01645 [Anaerolineaceae bacterium]|nr:hypothetical protein [Anaerolineaceae bacterium]
MCQKLKIMQRLSQKQEKPLEKVYEKFSNFKKVSIRILNLFKNPLPLTKGEGRVRVPFIIQIF